MSDAFLGIDLGTSSAKALLLREGKVTARGRALLRAQEPEGWISCVLEALEGIEGKKEITAIGLSSQTGTYLVNERHVLPWNGEEGLQELREIKSRFSEEEFCRETGMACPDLISYPLPKLLLAGRRYGELTSFCQPKDLICEFLTGKRMSDPYTWRGLADCGKGRYSGFLLKELGLREEILPPLASPWECIGRVNARAAEETGLPEGALVCTGLNDYFAALLGMGISRPGDWFDITGTSEHIGRIEERVLLSSGLISGPYLTGNVHYGVTASTGAALAFGRESFPAAPLWEELTEDWIRRAPVFLPYLKGRRSPEASPGASGSFAEIREGCTGEHLAYAVQEGVAFSLYHIYETVQKEAPQKEEEERKEIRVCGGAAVNPLLNHLKAELFERELLVMEEKDASALGAAFAAMIGAGALAGPADAAGLCRTSETIRPEGRFRALLKERYGRYRRLAQALASGC